MVDLGIPSLVKMVYIVNRGDCCGERLSGFDIRVGEYLRLFYNVFIDTTELRKIFLTMTALTRSLCYGAITDFRVEAHF